MATSSYPKRTEKNVIDSDGTVIFSHRKPTGGSALTAKVATKHSKPCLHVDFAQMDQLEAATEFHRWAVAEGISVLNVAGARA